MFFAFSFEVGVVELADNADLVCIKRLVDFMNIGSVNALSIFP